MGGVSLLFKLKLNDYSTVRFKLWINIFRKSVHIKSHSLSGSMIVGEAF